MKTKIIIGLITILNLSTAFAETIKRKDEDEKSKERLFQATVIPGFGTSNGAAEMYQNKLSFNLFAGSEYSFEGFEMGGFYNVDKSDITGVQIAGFGNSAGGSAIGLQLGGFNNIVKGELTGAQISGFLNYAGDSTKGWQLSGFTNISKGNIKGSQISGFANISTEDIKGAQISGFVNVSNNSKGLQMAGFVNKSNEINGMQWSGFLNKAKTVKGVQVGIINIADSVKSGATIGLINIVKSGLVQFATENNDVTDVNLVFRSGTKTLYTILSAGVETKEEFIWSYGVGLGTQHNFNNNVFGNIELSSHAINTSEGHSDDLNLLNRFNLNIGYQIARKLSLNAGPVLNIYVTRVVDPETKKYGTVGLAEKTFFNKTYSGTNLKMWIGYSVSLKF
ncbi:hypothetical protein [Reichenbachiella sp. MALMAid0571]|uniref:hypothetical protein n=1 Tax=Reichenbachiella sp. MALMAid0571 TaxID=3143939 RepID=UPI0032DFA175